MEQLFNYLLTQFIKKLFTGNVLNANLKNYEKSIECFEKILGSIDNNSTDAYYNLGNLKETGDMKLAKFAFNKTIELNKNFYQIQ